MKRTYLLCTVVILLNSCSQPVNKNAAIREGVSIVNDIPIHSYIVDSCEYVGYVGEGTTYSYPGIFLTHKGNCKFCEERRKKQSRLILSGNAY